MAVLTELRKLRKNLGLSQTYLAGQLGFRSATGYNTLECGRKRYVTQETITKLAQLLQVETADIVYALKPGGKRMKPLNLDRFEVGLPDPEDAPTNIHACTYDKCDNVILSGEEVFEYDEDYYCSSRCFHKHIGAKQVVAI